MIQYFLGLFSGLLVSAAVGILVWPTYIAAVRRRGETWCEARDREITRLDRMAELDEIPDTVRSYEDDRSIN